MKDMDTIAEETRSKDCCGVAHLPCRPRSQVA